jgi:hypothetical protein
VVHGEPGRWGDTATAAAWLPAAACCAGALERPVPRFCVRHLAC